MRHHGRVPCLAQIDYKAGDAVLGVRCAKDGRHGRGKKRQGFLYHRLDLLLPDGNRVKITWPGVGVMSPENERAYAEKPEGLPHRQGADTWQGP